jgi:predicted amidohydrolase
MLLHWIDELNGVSQAPPNHQVVRVGDLELGLAICADANSAWLNMEYKAAGIDALIYSVTSNVPPTAKILKSWPYSRKYDAWILAANRSGKEADQNYPGTVFVSDPTGRVRVIDDVDSGYVYAVIGRGK